ncbi:unnamed protein product [Rotaria magnacalcarata]
MGELVLQKNVRLGPTGLRLLATVGLGNFVTIIRNFDSYSVSFQTATPRAYSSERSIIQTLQFHHPIIRLNQPIDYLDPQPEYIRVIIIEWPIKFSIPIARTVSPDNQYSLLSVRRCNGLDVYGQQVDCLLSSL